MPRVIETIGRDYSMGVDRLTADKTCAGNAESGVKRLFDQGLDLGGGQTK